MIIEYLEAVRKLTKNSKQSKYFDWLIKNSKQNQISTLEGDNLKYVKKIIKGLGGSFGEGFPRNKECFSNSLILSIFSHGKIKYIEGFSYNEIPFEHGWNEYKGKQFDITAQFNDRLNIKSEYFGMKISHKDVMELGLDSKNKTVGSLLIKKFRKDVF